MHITGNACQNFYTHMQIPLSTAYASKAQGYHPPDRKYPQCHMVAGGFNAPRGWNLRGGLGWNHPICRDGTPAVTCLNHHNKIAVFMPPCCCGPKAWKKGYLLPFSLQIKPKNHVQESTQKIIKSGMGTSQWPCCPEAVSTSALNLKRSKGHMVAAIWLASSQGMIWQKTHPVCSFDSPFSKSYERGSVPMVEHLADQETKLVGLRRCHEGHREKLSLIYPSGLIHESADLCK